MSRWPDPLAPSDGGVDASMRQRGVAIIVDGGEKEEEEEQQ